MAEALTIENAHLIFRNFTGAKTEFNKLGDRNFAVQLDPEFAQVLEQDGWNIKWPVEREDIDPNDDPRLPYLKVKVQVTEFGPDVFIIPGEGNEQDHFKLGGDELGSIDAMRISNADLMIRPYHWEVNGKTGVTAYLQRAYITADLDNLRRKYGF
jgi:hypothetical protein